jgi:hypothetical protein
MINDTSGDSEALLVINFVNLKIKPHQSLKDARRDRMRIRVFIGVITRIYMSIYVYTVLKKISSSYP